MIPFLSSHRRTTLTHFHPNYSTLLRKFATLGHSSSLLDHRPFTVSVFCHNKMSTQNAVSLWNISSCSKDTFSFPNTAGPRQSSCLNSNSSRWVFQNAIRSHSTSSFGQESFDGSHKNSNVHDKIHEREQSSDLYDVSKTFQGPDACRSLGLTNLGIHGPQTLYHNLTYSQLFQQEIANDEGQVAHTKYGQCFAVDTGKFTGRSPKDKWVVLNPNSDSETHMDWGPINQPTKPEVFDELYDKAVAHFNTKDKAYVFDCYCGANPKTQKKIRFVHEMAW